MNLLSNCLDVRTRYEQYLINADSMDAVTRDIHYQDIAMTADLIGGDYREMGRPLGDVPPLLASCTLLAEWWKEGWEDRDHMIALEAEMAHCPQCTGIGDYPCRIHD
ncbi:MULTISPECIES: hypothetical protein [Pseudomonas]|uniref:hypothetical protein n=1 Tax=Pseudomonas TaxID=286 RepID=UPI002914C086|nr:MULTISPECIES: hypothetical protein [Pseudomonas]MDU8545700.1 hypothetical protein [Pseudomonas syringae group sp. J248-6]WPP02627.1 hypothetical protein SFA35_26370 [Pseudomonas sp. HR96]